MTIDSPPRRAVVIATRDRGAEVEMALRSVLASEAPDLEVVVVDQSTDDRTRQAVAVLLTDDRLTYVHSGRTGVSAGRNEAISRTCAEIILITDDDCVVPLEWIDKMTQPFHDDDRVGVVFCSVDPAPVSEPGHTPHVLFDGSSTIRSVGEAWRAGRRGLPLGAGMAVRRTAFEEVGGFDELLGAGARFGAAEDSDLSWRTLLRGWSTVHTGDVAVLHFGFRTLEEVRGLVRRDFFGVGGAVAKYLSAPDWMVRVRACAFVTGWALRFGLLEPSRALLAGGRPSGVRRPWFLLRGFVDGRRTRCDRHRLLYQPAVVAPR